MGCESVAYEAEGLMGYWLRGHEGERNNNNVNFSFSAKKLQTWPALFTTSGL